MGREYLSLIIDNAELESMTEGNCKYRSNGIHFLSAPAAYASACANMTGAQCTPADGRIHSIAMRN